MHILELYDYDMLQQINENVDLLEYVSQFIEMKKMSDNYFGRCPLHVDKTPSFSINPEKNFYYCFSCGKSGGIIGYLMDFEGMHFKDAVEKAAKLANIDLNKMCKSNTLSWLKKIKALNQKNDAHFIHPILSEDELNKYKKEPVWEWLQEGISQEAMDVFEIMTDEWHNRIVYPVYDIDGNLINVKARTRYTNYKELKIPKYINYYPIGVMDYFQGLNITLEYITEKKEIIIFESLKSVMKAFGWDYKNCVSAEKHSLTKEQIDLLVKLKVDIVFAYDSDISYRQNDVKQDIDKLKRITNVYIIEDRKKLLGGASAKNAPVDCGKEIWEELYEHKRKVV